MPDTTVTTIEIRLLNRQEAGYPIELTLAETGQVFHGVLPAALLPWTASGDARLDGQSLFNLLFASSDLLRGWGAASQAAARRIHLRIDPPELQALPWELLRDGQDLLASAASTPFSRYLAVSEKWGEAITARPLRVLAVISNPSDLVEKYNLPPADVDLETRELAEALKPLTTAVGATATITFLPAPITLDRLEDELRQGQGYHILHFVGHGVFNEKRQQAALYLQNADGTAQRVVDEDFTSMLNRLAAPPHVVVLAACRSAQQSMSAAFSGLGPKLVQIGLPAVVAMQDNVSVLTARQFTATFYRRLLDHGAIDRAMNEARGTLISQGRYDAAVPVLFMRLPDGQLWKSAAFPAQTLPAGQVDKVPHIVNQSGAINLNATGNVTINADLTGHDKTVNTITARNVTVDNRTATPSERAFSTGGGREGGVNFGGAKNVRIGGDVVGEDKITTIDGSKYSGGDDRSVRGWTAADIAQFFGQIKQRSAQRPNTSAQDKEDLQTDVADVQVEVNKGAAADDKALARSLRNIKRIAPEIFDVIVTTFADPAKGVAKVIRKVMDKAKAGS